MIKWRGVAPRGHRVGGSGTKRTSSGGEWHQEEACFIKWRGVAPRGGVLRQEEGRITRSASVFVGMGGGVCWSYITLYMYSDRACTRRTREERKTRSWFMKMTDSIVSILDAFPVTSLLLLMSETFQKRLSIHSSLLWSLPIEN